ncbi:MAG: hypothetical protein LBU89_07445 [Fibromonadaceae bacterium]|jgi:hypothetical protein|nr:hypothetical protein [Fibromonadaceae bacterium]
MEYFYKGRCEEIIPDFAALAVLEKQSCPPILENKKDWDRLWEGVTICTSRYRIIRVLDAVSDTLKKEYIEVKEKPVHPYWRHRPMLIFGSYEDGMIRIKGREETREYFDHFNYRESEWGGVLSLFSKFLVFFGFSSDIYALHSVGTPYYNVKNLDSIDMLFYYEYLMPKVKYHVDIAGKEFSELQKHLTQNRTSVKATKIKNDFAALGIIRNMRLVDDPKQAKFYELNVIIESISKNDAKINSNIAIYINKEHLPPSWGCLPHLNFLYKTPFYFFGDFKDGSLVIDSLVSPQDAFVFGDTIYDISMGLPFKKLVTYFLPSNISFEELEFHNKWGYIVEGFSDLPECLRKDIVEITAKREDFLKFDREKKFKTNFLGGFPLIGDKFRRGRPDYSHMPPPAFNTHTPLELKWPYLEEEPQCRPFNSAGEGLWGKWRE